MIYTIEKGLLDQNFFNYFTKYDTETLWSKSLPVLFSTILAVYFPVLGAVNSDSSRQSELVSCLVTNVPSLS